MSRADFAVNTYGYTLAYSAHECLTELAELGFTDFELMMYPGHAWPNHMSRGDRQALKQHVERLGVSINSLNQPNVDINLAAATPEMRKYSFDIVKSILELAGDLDVRWVVIGPGKVNPLMPAPREEVLARFHESLEGLIAVSKNAGTRILVENMPFAFLPDADSLMEAMSRYSDDDVGVIYDVANGAFIGEDIRHGLECVRSRLELVHVSDTPKHVYKHDPVGTGDIDFGKVAEDLASVEWNEKPVLEIISASRAPHQDLLDSIESLERKGWNQRRRTG